MRVFIELWFLQVEVIPLELRCSVIVSASCGSVCLRLCCLHLLQLGRLMQRLAERVDRIAQGTGFLKLGQVSLCFCALAGSAQKKDKTSMQIWSVVSLLMQMFPFCICVLHRLVGRGDRTRAGFPKSTSCAASPRCHGGTGGKKGF